MLVSTTVHDPRCCYCFACRRLVDAEDAAAALFAAHRRGVADGERLARNLAPLPVTKAS